MGQFSHNSTLPARRSNPLLSWCASISCLATDSCLPFSLTLLPNPFGNRTCGTLRTREKGSQKDTLSMSWGVWQRSEFTPQSIIEISEDNLPEALPMDAWR